MIPFPILCVIHSTIHNIQTQGVSKQKGILVEMKNGGGVLKSLG